MNLEKKRVLIGREKRHIPIRTCVSCGARRSKNELVRMVMDDQGFVIRDNSGKGQGRGAYICSNKSCGERLGKGCRINRAFRKDGPVAFHPEFHSG